MDFVRAADACSAAIEADQKRQVRSECPPTARALPAKRNFKRGAFGSPKSAARQKIYAISSTSSTANALTVCFENEPGQACRREAAHPRPSAAHRRQHRQAAGFVAQELSAALARAYSITLSACFT